MDEKFTIQIVDLESQTYLSKSDLVSFMPFDGFALYDEIVVRGFT